MTTTQTFPELCGRFQVYEVRALGATAYAATCSLRRAKELLKESRNVMPGARIILRSAPDQSGAYGDSIAAVRHGSAHPAWIAQEVLA